VSDRWPRLAQAGQKFPGTRVARLQCDDLEVQATLGFQPPNEIDLASRLRSGLSARRQWLATSALDDQVVGVRRGIHRAAGCFIGRLHTGHVRQAGGARGGGRHGQHESSRPRFHLVARTRMRAIMPLSLCSPRWQWYEKSPATVNGISTVVG